MNKTQQHIHLNSNIENVGSDPNRSEVTKSMKEEMRQHRLNWNDYCNDFHENIGEIIASFEINSGLRWNTVFKRYTQFFNDCCLYKYYFEAAPLLPPMWDAFIEYENGGLSPIVNPVRFKERLYRSKKKQSANCIIIGN